MADNEFFLSNVFWIFMTHIFPLWPCIILIHRYAPTRPFTWLAYTRRINVSSVTAKDRYDNIWTFFGHPWYRLFLWRPYSRILHYYSDQGDATIPVFSQAIIMIRVTVELSTGLPQGTSPRPQNIPLISQINAALGYGCVGLPQFLFRGRFSRTPNWTISPVQENL